MIQVLSLAWRPSVFFIVASTMAYSRSLEIRFGRQLDGRSSKNTPHAAFVISRPPQQHRGR
jgi:hypothetical protein